MDPTEPAADKLSDLLCTGQVDVSKFSDTAPKHEPCMNNEYYLQGTPSGHYRAICTKCGKEYDLS